MINRAALDHWCERAILVLVLAILTLTPLAFGGRPQPVKGNENWRSTATKTMIPEGNLS